MPEKTVAEKLMMKPGRKVRLIHAPDDALALLGGLPAGVELQVEGAPADVLVLFAHNRADLEALLPGLRTGLTPGGMVWVAYHKGTSKVKTDIHRDSIATYGETLGFSPVAMVAINDDWAALRLREV